MPFQTQELLHNDQIDPIKWGRLLEISANASVFQTHAWFDFLSRRQDPGQEPFVLAVQDEGGELSALVSAVIMKEKGLKSFMTRRAIVMGGIVHPHGERLNRDAGLLLIQGLNRYLGKAKVIYSEIRNFNDYTSLRDIFHRSAWQYQPHLNFHVDCSDMELMKKRVSSSKMRQVRGSLKKGATFRWAENHREVSALYSILKAMYREKVGTPLPDEAFFTAYFNIGGKVLIVLYQDQVVGGMVCPILEGRVVYEYYVTGRDSELKSEGIFPSVLATWGAMEMAHREGIPRFDFMGAGKPGVAYGVRDFKAKFGGELVEYGRFLKVFSPFRYYIGKMLIYFIKGK